MLLSLTFSLQIIIVKKLKRIVALLLICSFVIGNAMVIGASDIMPIFSHCADCTMAFNIIDGIAYIGIDYVAYESFAVFDATVKVQKRVLGIFWDTIEIGANLDAWVISSISPENSLDYSFPLEKTGTYRAVFDIQFRGEDGTLDEIDHKIQDVYE